MGLVGLLTIPGVAAQGKDTTGDVSVAIDGLKIRQKYPNLDSTLNGLVAGNEARRASARAAVNQAPVRGKSSVAVTIYVSANVSTIRSFLENNGADVRTVGEDYIEAYVPVTLLGQLSEQSGVTRVETVFGPKEVGTLPLKPAWPPLQPLA